AGGACGKGGGGGPRGMIWTTVSLMPLVPVHGVPLVVPEPGAAAAIGPIGPVTANNASAPTAAAASLTWPSAASRVVPRMSPSSQPNLQPAMWLGPVIIGTPG